MFQVNKHKTKKQKNEVEIDNRHHLLDKVSIVVEPCELIRERNLQTR